MTHRKLDLWATFVGQAFERKSRSQDSFKGRTLPSLNIQILLLHHAALLICIPRPQCIDKIKIGGRGGCAKFDFLHEFLCITCIPTALDKICWISCPPLLNLRLLSIYFLMSYLN